MKRIFVPLLAVVVAISFLPQAKPQQSKTDLPKVFDNARYVFVEASREDSDNLDPYPEDREAVSNVEKALHAWGRYRMAMSRDEADLVLVVHKARRTNSNIPVVVGGGQPGRGKSPLPQDPASDPSDPSGPSPGGGGRGTGLGKDTNSPDDQLSVYLGSSSGSLSSPIWRESQKNGLKAPQLALFQRLKKEVDEAYPQ